MISILTTIVALSAAAPAPAARLDLTVEIEGQSEVSKARYYLQQVPCAGKAPTRASQLTVERDINEMAGFAVEPGCYEVHFAPLDAQGNIMPNCEPGVAIAPVDEASPTRVVFVTTCHE